jgi:hypothetical protein
VGEIVVILHNGDYIRPIEQRLSKPLQVGMF